MMNVKLANTTGYECKMFHFGMHTQNISKKMYTNFGKNIHRQWLIIYKMNFWWKKIKLNTLKLIQ